MESKVYNIGFMQFSNYAIHIKFCHSFRDEFRVNNCTLLNDIDSPLNSTKRKVNDEDISIKGNKGGRKEEWKDVVDF